MYPIAPLLLTPEPLKLSRRKEGEAVFWCGENDGGVVSFSSHKRTHPYKNVSKRLKTAIVAESPVLWRKNDTNLDHPHALAG